MKKIIFILILFYISLGQEIRDNFKKINKIYLLIRGNTTIQIGKKENFRITGSKEELNKIKYTIQGTKLVIQHKDTENYSIFLGNNELPQITINLTSLEKLISSKGGTMQIFGLNEKKFEFGISGSKDVNIEGTAEYFKLKTAGSGDIKFTGLHSKEIYVHKNGSEEIQFEGSVEKLLINSDGSGYIKWKNLSAQKIILESSGSSDFIFKGKADKLHAIISGSTHIEGLRMEVETLFAKISGSGDVNLTVKDELKAKVYGSGSIFYAGNPTILKEIYGSGQIEKQQIY
jgi:hypothetical protein